jgi:hypothetical protein
MDGEGHRLSEREVSESNISEFLAQGHFAFPVAALRAGASQAASFVISFAADCCVNFRLAY